MTRRWCFTAIFGCFLLLNGILAIRIKDNIYTDLNERAFCFRRTNGTHQMGCSSDLNGNVGVIHLVSSPEDLQWLLTKGIHDPYVAILTPTMFNKDTMTRLKKSDKISGMLLLGVNNTIDILKPPNKHSDDSSCPNQESSLYRREDSSSDENCQAEQNPWNPEASDILFQDWSIPLFLIDDPKIVDRLLNECYERFNKPDQDGNPRSWPLCAVEMKAHMYAAVDTKTCQRRNRLVNPFSPTHICDPLGDRNIFHLFSQNFDNQSRFEDRSILLVSARLDTINTFDKVETGLDSPSTGIVTLLAAAEMLAKSQFKPQDGKNVLFGLLNGESFDYIGSSRMIYDMKENKFPQEVETSDESKITWPLINLDSLEAQIELGQLMNNGNEGTMFTHMDTQFPAAGQDLLRDLRNEAQKLGLTLDSPTLDKGLPPSSIQSLLKEDRSVPGIFLANFDQKYINKYYHSLYDNSSKSGYDHAIPDNKLVQHLSKIAETVARLVWSRVGQGQAPGQDFKANKTLINDLIYCYTISANCSMFAAVTSSDFVSKKSLPTKPLPQYVGVDRSLTYHTIFTYRVLSYLTSKSLDGPFTPENCTTPQNQSMYSYLFIKGNSPPNWWTGTPQECQDSLECGFCLNTTSWMAEAVSPAFVIDDYDFHDPQYASWAESSWQFTSSRMFLKASPYQERGYFALGIIMLVLSFCIVIWLDKYASLIFVPETSTPEDQEPIQPPTAL